jgi:hypothetical protein
LSEEQIAAAVEVARGYGSYATAHAHGAEGIRQAISAGVRSIEHASLIDAEGIRMAKDAGTWLVMDIYNGDFIEEVGTRDGWPADMLRKNEETTKAQREGFTAAVRAGVRIAYGPDAGDPERHDQRGRPDGHDRRRRDCRGPLCRHGSRGGGPAGGYHRAGKHRPRDAGGQGGAVGLLPSR